MKGNINDYVSRLTKYYTIFGQFVSSQQPVYRIRVTDNVEIRLSQDNEDIVISLIFRYRSADDVDAVRLALERITAADAGNTSSVEVSMLEESNIF